MPGTVEDVRIGGTWEADGKSGAYRIVIARSGGEAITARLFVQWIAYGDNGEATVDKSIEIKEVGDLQLDIVDYTSESDADGLSVFIETLGPGRQGRRIIRASLDLADRLSLRSGDKLADFAETAHRA